MLVRTADGAELALNTGNELLVSEIAEQRRVLPAALVAEVGVGFRDLRAVEPFGRNPAALAEALMFTAQRAALQQGTVRGAMLARTAGHADLFLPAAGPGLVVVTADPAVAGLAGLGFHLFVVT